MRNSIFFAVLVAAIALVQARAEAVTEFCPAIVDDFTALHRSQPEAKTTRAPASLYSYELWALAARTVSGDLAIDTDKGWFTVAFGKSHIAGHEALYKSAFETVKRRDFYSAPQYVSFPEPVTILYAWVYDARVADDAVSQWSKMGDVQCVNAGYSKPKPYHPKPSEIVASSHPALTELPKRGDAIAAALAVAPPDGLTCKRPFSDAVAAHVVAPDYPEAMEAQQAGFAIVEVAVAINSDGKAIDVWLWAPSKYPSANRAALRAAKLSSYRPAIWLCRPVPGRYLFRADFAGF